MTNRLMVFLLLGTMTLLAAPSAEKQECKHQLPEELRNLAAGIGCKAVPGFYDRLGMVEPPYLYGYLPGDKEESAVFWCYREAESKPYLLVFVGDLGMAREGRITSTIPWQNFPGGLSLYDTRHVPLSEFRYVDDPNEYGPKGKMTEYPPLQDYYDGVITLFYREGDQWLYEIIE